MRKIVVLWVLFMGIGFAARAGDVKDLGRIVVTPNRDVQAAADAPSYVQVITAEDIAASGAFTLPDVLSRQAGVRVYNKGSVKNTLVDIGGYNDAAVSNVLVLLNGRRLNPSDSSGPDLASVPVETIERIEIIRGGASVLYGDNAVGGVVNIITKKGREGVSGSFAAEIGSYGQRKVSADVSVGKGALSVLVAGSTQQANGYRANSGYRAGDGQVRIDWKAASLLDLGVEAGWHEDDYGMPSGLSLAQIGSLGLRGTRKPDDYGDTRDRFIRFTSAWTPGDAGGDLGTVSLDYAHRDRDIYARLFYAPSDFEATKTGTRNDSAGLKYRIDGELAGHKAGFIAGLDIMDDRSHSLYEYYSPTPGWSSYLDWRISRKEQGYYSRVEYEVMDHWTVDAGGRYEIARYTFDNRSALTTTRSSPGETLWGGGLKYDYAQGSNVFIRADETFRFLNTDEWFSRWTGLSTTLRHQAGVDYRAGVKHAFGDAVQIKVTPFLTRNKDEIFLDPTVYPGNNGNYGRTQRAGVETGVVVHLAGFMDQRWLKAADLSLDHRFLDAAFNGGVFAGNQIPMAPRHQASFAFDLAARSGFTWNLTARFTGAQYGINDDNNVKSRMKPFTVIDTRVGWRIREAWEPFVAVNNLFDEKYDEYLSYGTGASTNVDHYPAMGRNYVGGVKYRF